MERLVLIALLYARPNGSFLEPVTSQLSAALREVGTPVDNCGNVRCARLRLRRRQPNANAREILRTRPGSCRRESSVLRHCPEAIQHRLEAGRCPKPDRPGWPGGRGRTGQTDRQTADPRGSLVAVRGMACPIQPTKQGAQDREGSAYALGQT